MSYTYKTMASGHVEISKNGAKVFDIVFSHAYNSIEKARHMATMVEMLESANAGPIDPELLALNNRTRIYATKTRR